jgi:hypothetical protein
MRIDAGDTHAFIPGRVRIPTGPERLRHLLLISWLLLSY